MSNLVSFDASKSLLPVTAQVPATIVSADQQNLGRAGVQLGVNVTNDTGATGTVTVTIQGKDVVSGQYRDILSTTALNVASGMKTLVVYPGITAAANASASDVIPATWRVKAVIATANCTFTVGLSGLV